MISYVNVLNDMFIFSNFYYSFLIFYCKINHHREMVRIPFTTIFHITMINKASTMSLSKSGVTRI